MAKGHWSIKLSDRVGWSTAFSYVLKKKAVVMSDRGDVGLPLVFEFCEYRSTLGFDIKQPRIGEPQQAQASCPQCE